MASSLLEQARGSHEEVERLERLIVKALKNEARTHKEKLSQNHKVRKILDVMQDKSAKLAKIYHDDDNARKEEINSMAGENVFSIFYDKLKETREYHKRYPSYDITEAENDEELLSLYNTHVEFSGEEASGRCLDLHHLHQIYLNSKFGKKIDYITYINNLSNFSEIPRQLRLSRPYRDYLGALLAYLGDFYNRTQPLGGKDRELKKFDQEFDEKFDKGEIAGWEDRGEGKISGGDASSQIDLEAFESAEELATLGPDRLKDALQSLGLKAGGTLEQRAERLMMTKGKPLESLDRKLFAKGSAPAAALPEQEREKQRAAARQSARLEGRVLLVVQMLGSVIDDTVANVEKKQARTYDELQVELEEAQEEELDEDSDEEDEYIYNPLKLPLGWDGKPIPYWLYKLHGLNQEFKCEICGNASYWGRRAFERHFKEWRHVNGMRALGIPNNKNFYEVTKIDDALALHKTLLERQSAGTRDLEEEFEDAQGNVYDKKTFEDFKRQGLV
uniref:Splicing factor 3A subunit 3 n=2 Tax=Tetraselmis sp. GSL018 TaxID=582737 RepID=A0A061SF95_9CHLO|mmetsp:Transcript_43186/g.102477  ORF Transcript_43186/g.102477 Transcript_43186/m.102477 type:complete len:504 (+) Transcript_43186:89-1600(+)